MNSRFAAGALALALLFVGPSAMARREDVAADAMARVQEGCRIRPYSMLITIRNVKDTKGVITIDLHGDNPTTFLKKGSKLLEVWVPPVKGQTQACVPIEGPGLYAVAIYQDKNLNLTFDRNFLGLPAEPYGVSNDPPMAFGLPGFKDSAVRVDGPLTPVTVTLHN